jgi:uncharacterized protein (DUF2267 family)
MKSSIKFFFLLVISSCSSRKEPNNGELTNQIQNTFPQEIKSIYVQKWIGGQELTGSGTNFYIEFQKPLSKEIQLQKIYFQNQEAILESESEAGFVAHFYQKPKKDIVLDVDPTKEFGNEPPEIIKPKFSLQPNQAIIEYKINNKTLLFKISNIKEKELIAYPSMGRPKN